MDIYLEHFLLHIAKQTELCCSYNLCSPSACNVVAKVLPSLDPPSHTNIHHPHPAPGCRAPAANAANNGFMQKTAQCLCVNICVTQILAKTKVGE